MIFLPVRCPACRMVMVPKRDGWIIRCSKCYAPLRTV